MHYVCRGPEPKRLKQFRIRYTSGWVNHYRHNNPRKPNDTYWQLFHKDLRNIFFSLCAYCEKYCKGEIDHFRPKNKYPEFVYKWANWLFVCHDCNNKKGNKWPPYGFIDPCSKTKKAWPEMYFHFDSVSGEIIPREGLTKWKLSRAKNTIYNLGLNDYHHLKKRQVQIAQIRIIIDALPYLAIVKAENLRNYLVNLCSHKSELCSLSRALIKKLLPAIAF